MRVLLSCKQICTLACLLVLQASPCFAKLTPVEVLAATILGEARGEGGQGMLAVANVIVVRLNERNTADINQVCLRPLQFSFWNRATEPGARALFKLPQSVYAFELASNILNKRPIKNVTNGANHYHAASCNPSWALNKKPVAVIGQHLFYHL